jgi:tRNA1(Val) A37 N6-methylase TrmN6
MNEAPSTTLGAWLGGKLQLRQPAKGHRAGTDAALLAAASPDATRIVDAGAGVGAVGLAIAARCAGAVVRLVEIDPWLAALAAENATRNRLEAQVHCVDLLKPAARRASGLIDAAADCVVTNPPFYQAGAVRASPDARRAGSHVLKEGGSLQDWVAACLALLEPGGRFVMIHRADALGAILAACERRIGGLEIRPVHTRAGASASRLLVSGVKGSRAPLALMPGLILHDAAGAFTPEADTLHRGEGRL